MKLSALLVLTVHLAALAVVVRDPSEHLLAGVVVLSAVLWRLRAPLSHVVGALRRPRHGTVDEIVLPATAPS